LRTSEEIQRLNEELNEVIARSNAELVAADDERRAALMALSAGRAALDAFDQAVQRAETGAVAAQQNADEGRTRADAKAAQTRADEEDTAYAAFLANDPETVRQKARQKANEDCDHHILEVGRRIPPVSGPVMDAERRSAFKERDAAHGAADEACEEALRNRRDTLLAANDAALRKHADAADAAAAEHQQRRDEAERMLRESIEAANQAFARTVRGDPAAAAIELAYARTKRDIEERAEAQKQDIFRRLRSDG
jgi:hypothetical protein